MIKFWLWKIIVAFPALTVLSTSALANPDDSTYRKALHYLEYRQAQSACRTLASSLILDRTICEGQSSVTFKQKLESVDSGHYNHVYLLGIALRQLGYYDLSRDALEFAKTHTTTANDIDNISMSLANVAQGEFAKTLNQYNTSDKKDKKDEASERLFKEGQSALTQYQQLWESKSVSLQTKARLNWLLVASSINDEFPELLKLVSPSQAKQVIQFVDSRIVELPENEQIDVRLKFAESLRKLTRLDTAYLDDAQKQSQTALRLSRQAKNSIAASRAIGLSGRIFLQNSEIGKAAIAFEQAQSLALSYRALDVAYQWEWELGKIYAKAGDARALPQYKAAVDNLNELRKNLIEINPDLQFGFQAQVEPLYKEYLELLFKEKQPDLKEIIKTNEKVQVTELENYLQCSQLKVFSLLNLSSKDSPDAAIYIIRLPKQYELIVRLKNGELIHRSANFTDVEEALDKIRQNLSSEQLDNLDSGGFKDLFGRLYQSLFVPIEGVLPKKGTIVFSGDSELMSVPWSILYDGNQYLIERYSIAYTLGIDTQAPKEIARGRFRVLAAGLSNLSGKSNFKDLEFVPEELEGIKDTVPDSDSLLDQQFTTKALLANSARFPIIHIATHGQFSSNPNESFLVNWDSKISLREIRQLLSGKDIEKASELELLVLSACESAKGDKRAGLGLAGTAIQAGARSTIASQWVINDRSQADLVKKFYQELMKGKPKAEALREAQLLILKSSVLGDKFSNPYYWAMNVLIGSWL
jgi:CHAT domain-containing protein